MATVTTKICGKCKTEKDFSLFAKQIGRKFNLASNCKECRNNYYHENKEKISKTQKNYYENNKDKVSKIQKEYYESNKDKIAKYKNEWRKKKRDSNCIFAMKLRCRNLIRNSFIRYIGHNKKSKTFEILGCDFETFAKHIESQFIDGMTWENRNEWHIDHIIPLASAKTEDDVIRLNHHLNLRPLLALENILKKDTMPKQSTVNSIELKIAKEKHLKLIQRTLF